MKLGIYGLNEGVGHTPEATRRLVPLADELGFESWWVGEHVVLPSPRTTDSPLEPGDPILDPFVHLAFVTALSTRLQLGVGIAILPQRNPLALAKEAASLDVLCGGRLHLGVAAGYLEPELDAMGVRMADRGARTDEHIEVMRSLWAEPARDFGRGRFHNFAGVDAHPKPVQPNGVRLVVGGHSRPALARAQRTGHGWYGSDLDPSGAAAVLDRLRRIGGEIDRDEALGPLELSITPPPGPVTDDDWARYRDLGIDRLIPYPDRMHDLAVVERFMGDLSRFVGR